MVVGRDRHRTDFQTAIDRVTPFRDVRLVSKNSDTQLVFSAGDVKREKTTFAVPIEVDRNTQNRPRAKPRLCQQAQNPRRISGPG